MQLDEFLEKISGLPIDCNRNLRLMRELDIEFECTLSSAIFIDCSSIHLFVDQC